MFKINKVPTWFEEWIKFNKKSIKDVENVLNNCKQYKKILYKINQTVVDTPCIKCNKVTIRTKGSIKTNIKLGKFTLLCKQCMSGVHKKSYLGKYIDNKGYVLLRKSDIEKEYHWLLEDENYLLEHRFIMGKHLNRKIRKDENIHHINGVKDDNRLENLELWSTSQPSGQRVRDKIKWAKEILKIYKNYKE